MAVLRLRQWASERQAVKAGKTTNYRKTGWQQRKLKTCDARIVRVIDFERAFGKLSEEHQFVLLGTYRDGLNQGTVAELMLCSSRKVSYVLPEARAALALILDRLDLL
jgi:DNA-directed RNA polymerase specialized sigma24 family protein